MLKKLLKKFGPRSLDSALNETKTIYIDRVRFTIKKLNPLDHLSGAKIMLQNYDIYKVGNTKEEAEQSSKKIKEHYIDIFMASVIHPVLSRDKDIPYTVYVGDIFNNWQLAEDLYMAIHEYTYGKKKT